MPDLFFNTGRVFEIYSIGDGLYMKRVLNGVAMLSNSGLFITLGLIGLMLGLLLIGFKGVATGLQKVELGKLMVCFLVFTAMFGMRANVIVNDMGGAPGAIVGASYPVDNVPYGVAFLGYMISTLGYNLTESMQQAYGLPAQSDPDGAASFGRTLEWLDAVRNWNIPQLAAAENDPTLPNFKANQASYLAYCTFVAARSGKLNLALAYNAKDPWSKFGTPTTGGFGFDNAFLTFPFLQSDGTQVDYDCKNGRDRVAPSSDYGAVYTAFSKSIASRAPIFQGLDGGSSEQALNDAFGNIGVSAAEAQKYVMISATLAAARTAQALGSHATGTAIMSSIVAQQGQMQRAVQWASNETMFRSVARPMTAFFESMIYACAPFMALLVGLGPWGLQMVARYCILTIWVALWQPVMSICNLFQVTMAQHAVDAMRLVNNGGSDLATDSLTGAAHLQLQIQNWLAVGSMLAASTPAITMMLVFGGAMTATALASRLQGGDVIDEKAVSPDATHTAAAMGVMSRQENSPIAGGTTANATSVAPRMQSSQAQQHMTSSQDLVMRQSARQFTQVAGASLSHAVSSELSNGTYGAHGDSQTATSAQSEVAAFARAHGLDRGLVSDKVLTEATTLSATGELGASVDLLGGAMAKAARAAGKKVTSGGMTGGPKGSIAIDGKVVDIQGLAQSLGEHAREEASRNSSFALSLANAANDSLDQRAGAGAKDAQSAVGSQEYKDAKQNLQRAQSTFTAVQSASQQLGLGQSADVISMGHMIVGSGHANDVVNGAMQHMGADAVNKATQFVRNSAWAPRDDDAQHTKARVMGALLAYAGKVPGGGGTPQPGHEKLAAQSFVQALQYGGFAGADGMNAATSGSPTANAGVAPDVPAHGAVAAAVGSAKKQAPQTTSFGAVQGNAAATLNGANQGQHAQWVQDATGMNAFMGSGAQHDAQEIAETGRIVATNAGSTVDAIYKGGSNKVGKDAYQARQDQVAGAAEAAGKNGQPTPKAVQAGMLGERELGPKLGGTGVNSVATALNIASTDGNYDPTTSGTSQGLPPVGFGITSYSQASHMKEGSRMRADANAKFAASANALLSNPDNRDTSRSLLIAKAVTATVRDTGGATPEEAQAFYSAYNQLTPAERTALRTNEMTSRATDGGNDVWQTRLATPGSVQGATATGKTGLSAPGEAEQRPLLGALPEDGFSPTASNSDLGVMSGYGGSGSSVPGDERGNDKD